MKTIPLAVILWGLLSQSAFAAPPVPKLEAVPYTAVEIDDAFWSPRIRTNREHTIPHILDMCELEGRVRNMWRAAGKLDGQFEGTRHHDADLFKAIEAASYALKLDFVPLYSERYDLIIPQEFADSELLGPVFDLLEDPQFREAVSQRPGYDVSQMGNLVADLG